MLGERNGRRRGGKIDREKETGSNSPSLPLFEGFCVSVGSLLMSYPLCVCVCVCWGNYTVRNVADSGLVWSRSPCV